MVKSLQDSGAVRQANALAKSGQELDLIEKRLLLVAMSRITKGDTELLTHRISVTELAPFFGGDPWRAAQKAARGLLKRVVYIKGEEGGFTAFQWTTLARYVPAGRSEDGSSYLEIRLNEELAPYLLELKERFNVIPLLELLPMASVNSQRLYEVLWHDSFKAQKQFLTYDLEQLRFQLGLKISREVKGKEVWVEKYSSWRDFQKVLKRAQADFMTHGSLAFDYEGIAQGRTTTQVRFRISRKHDDKLNVEQPLDPALEAQKCELAGRLEAAGYHQDALAAVETYGLDVAEMALKLALTAERTSARSAKPIYNPGGLIHHALKSGLAARRLEKPETASTNPTTETREVARGLIEAFTSARHAFAETLWTEMRPEDQKAFPGIMQLELSSYQIDQLQRTNWEGSQFEFSKREVLLSLYPDDIPDHLTDLAYFTKHTAFFSGYEKKTVAAILREAEAQL